MSYLKDIPWGVLSTLIGLLFSGYFLYFRSQLKRKNGREQYGNVLKNTIWDENYRLVLIYILKRFDFFNGGVGFESIYLKCLLISLAYTYVFFNGNWVAGGSSHFVGIQIFPFEETTFRRSLIVLTAVAAVIAFIIVYIKTEINKWHYFINFSLVSAWYAYFKDIQEVGIITLFAFTFPQLSLPLIPFYLIIKMGWIDNLNIESIYLNYGSFLLFVLSLIVVFFILKILKYSKYFYNNASSASKDGQKKINTYSYKNNSNAAHLGPMISIIFGFTWFFMFRYIQNESIDLIELMFGVVAAYILLILIGDYLKIFSVLIKVFLLICLVCIICGSILGLAYIVFKDPSGCLYISPVFSVTIVLLVIFPLINSFFDFLSYGFSVYLIHRLKNATIKRYSYLITIISHILLDFIFALLVLYGLSKTMLIASNLFFLHVTKNPACAVFELSPLLSRINNNPVGLDSSWVLALLLTTFIPTAIHLILAVTSVIRNLVPLHLRKKSLILLGYLDTVHQKPDVTIQDIKYYRYSHKNLPSEFGLSFVAGLLSVSITFSVILVLSGLLGIALVLFSYSSDIGLDIYNNVVSDVIK